VRELVRMTVAALNVRRALKSRRSLDLWYGERRHDPGPPS
jgi:hypothetical protein